MGIQSKRQYLQTIRHWNRDATRDPNTQILDEFCSVCRYNRKDAIWLLNANGRKKLISKRKLAVSQSMTIRTFLRY